MMDDDRFDTEIAKAKSTMLGVEDHGILSATVEFDYGGSRQGIPGYTFDTPVKYTSFKGKYHDGSTISYGEHYGDLDLENGRVGTAYGMEFIRRLLLAFGVDQWEHIVGRTVFVLKDKGDRYGYIKGIRPLPTEGGREFVFEDLSVLIKESRDIIKEKK
jgi:hypothetical protein